MSKLDEARSTIEEIDLSIAKLFEKRMDASKIIAEYKKENGLLIEDKKRENELIKKNSLYVNTDLQVYYREFLQNVMNISKKYQRDYLNNKYGNYYNSFASSNILIEKDARDKIKDVFNLQRKVLILTDDGVPKAYSQRVKDLSKEGIIITLPQGEQNKCFETFKAVIKVLIDNNFTRSDCILAVGGGVVGDLAGFVASVYMRGIDFFNIPTTLLAQVDSSIGGKTAIDFFGYKNIVGAFYQPKKVLIDTSLLDTLPKEQFSCGMAEIIKVFATSDREMFEYLENSTQIDIDKVVERAIIIKKKVVEKDEKEQGLRRVLNFGHTVGHGIESAKDNTLLHGQCVGLGMLCMSCKTAKNRIKNLLIKYNLPTTWQGNEKELIRNIIHDKKSESDFIHTIYVDEIGEYKELKMTVAEIIEKSKEVLTLQ